MSDDKNDRGPRDASRINLHEDYEARYWTTALGVSSEDLEAAVRKVGVSADAVRKNSGEQTPNLAADKRNRPRA